MSILKIFVATLSCLLESIIKVRKALMESSYQNLTVRLSKLELIDLENMASEVKRRERGDEVVLIVVVTAIS